MGTVCVSNRTNQPIDTGTFECILPTELKPTEVKSNLVEVQEMCATKIQALFRGHSVRKLKKELEESFYPPSDVAVKTDQAPEIFHHVVSKVLLQLGQFDYSNCQQIVGAKTLPAYEFVGKGGIYLGQWKDHKRNGKGQYIFPDGSVYEGCWENDKANGYGRLIMATGDYYIGEWKDDKNDGYGVYVHADKSRYEGFWRDDLRHGQGKEIWSDESAQYEGNFVKGVKEGYGIYQWGDGSNYEGCFKNGQFHGKGKYRWADGSVYDGEWQNNKMNGKGEMLWEDKKRYIGKGSYKDHKKDGYGEIYWPDGRAYKGYWVNGLQHGEGLQIDKYGKQTQGEWFEGQRR